MAYIGNRPEQGNFRKCDAITTSATATYNLLVGGVAVNPNQNQVICSLNGVVQSSGDSFTIASSQITFASTLASSDVIDFILILGDTLDVGVPSDDTVDASKITANVITGQTALGATPADTDELLISDAGTLKRVDYSHLKSTVVNRPNVSPLLMNGDFAIAQRGTSKATIGNEYGTCDRWYSNTQVGAFTQSQDTDVPSGYGFANSLKMDCTTSASPTSGQRNYIQQRFEGQDLQLLKKGTSNAEIITLSFWVKSVKTGTYIIEVQDVDNSRQISKSYTISSASTWEKKIISFAGDTTGALGDDNGRSFDIAWYLSAGSDYTSGTLSTSWSSVTNANRAVGQVNLADSTSNNWWLTGVQLEVGEYTASTIPPFQHESFGNNLARCQRYYLRYQGDASDQRIIANGFFNSGSNARILINFPVTMRATGTITESALVSLWQGGSSEAVSLAATIDPATNGVLASMNSDAGSPYSSYLGQAVCLRTSDSTSSFLAVDSEL